ncbi:hypothetical protein Dimus_036075 [Dionaea muscipula]
MGRRSRPAARRGDNLRARRQQFRDAGSAKTGRSLLINSDQIGTGLWGSVVLCLFGGWFAGTFGYVDESSAVGLCRGDVFPCCWPTGG